MYVYIWNYGINIALAPLSQFCLFCIQTKQSRPMSQAAMSTTLDKENVWLTCNGLMTDHSPSLEVQLLKMIQYLLFQNVHTAAIRDEFRGKGL